jgi:hypothetical protein
MEVTTIFSAMPQLIWSWRNDSWSDEVRLPIRTTVMGQELVWILHHRGANYYDSELHKFSCKCKFMLECESDFPERFTYTVDFGRLQAELKSEGPFLLNTWYTVVLPTVARVLPLRIELGKNGRESENRATIRRLFNEASGDVELRCGDLVVKAHRAILEAFSDTLKGIVS